MHTLTPPPNRASFRQTSCYCYKMTLQCRKVSLKCIIKIRSVSTRSFVDVFSRRVTVFHRQAKLFEKLYQMFKPGRPLMKLLQYLQDIALGLLKVRWGTSILQGQGFMTRFITNCSGVAFNCLKKVHDNFFEHDSRTKFCKDYSLLLA